MGVKTNRTSSSHQTPQHGTKNVKKCNLRTWMQQVKVRKIIFVNITFDEIKMFF
jgi:hypothetical protein